MNEIQNDKERFGISYEQLPLSVQALFETDQDFFYAVYQPDYQKANVHGHQALALWERLPNTENEQLRVIANLIQNKVLVGDMESAEKLIRKGQALLPVSDAKVYQALFVYACSLYLNTRGDLDDLIQLIDRHQLL